MYNKYYNTYTTVRGDIMPKRDTAKWKENDLVYYLKPRGIRQFWFFWKYLPYITGDTLDLRLCVQSKDSDVYEYNFDWQLQYWSPLQEQYVSEISKSGSFFSVSRGRQMVTLDTHLLMHEAEYHIIITVRRADKPQVFRTQTLLNFKVMPCDVFYTGIIKTLTSGIIGAIIGAALAAIATLATRGS